MNIEAYCGIQLTLMPETQKYTIDTNNINKDNVKQNRKEILLLFIIGI